MSESKEITLPDAKSWVSRLTKLEIIEMVMDIANGDYTAKDLYADIDFHRWCKERRKLK